MELKGGVEVPLPFLDKIYKIKNVKSPFIVLVWFHILLHVSSFPLFSSQNWNVPSCLCKYLLLSEETFCFFSNVLSRKKCWNDVQTCCRSDTASRGTRCWRPTSPAPYSSLSASTSSRWSLFQSEFGNKNGLVCSPNQTWSVLPQKKSHQHHPISTELSLYILQMITFPEWV